MNWNTRGTWLQGEHPEAETEHDSMTIKLPDETPDWNDSTIHLERLHDVLVAKGWGRGPI